MKTHAQFVADIRQELVSAGAFDADSIKEEIDMLLDGTTITDTPDEEMAALAELLKEVEA